MRVLVRLKLHSILSQKIIVVIERADDLSLLWRRVQRMPEHRQECKLLINRWLQPSPQQQRLDYLKEVSTSQHRMEWDVTGVGRVIYQLKG